MRESSKGGFLKRLKNDANHEVTKVTDQPIHTLVVPALEDGKHELRCKMDGGGWLARMWVQAGRMA